jgi:DNA-binding HxlR family transcriptional regulator
MARETFDKATNPYHYALHCLGGKWKMTILHEIDTYGVIHFNKTLKVLPISEKVLSQQLKELIQDGLVKRIVNSDTFPPSTDYVLTEAGTELIPLLDALYIWSIRQMDAKGIPIDADAFVVHQNEKYFNALADIMRAHSFEPETDRSYSKKKPNKVYW